MMKMKIIMSRENELEILIAALRSKIYRSYKNTNHLTSMEFLAIYQGIRDDEHQLDKYIVELQDLI